MARLLSVLLLCAGLIVTPAYAEEERINEWDIRTVNGQISDLDDMTGRITIRWLNAVMGVTYDQYEEVTLLVPKAAKIMQGTDRIYLSDLSVGQDAIARYHLDESGKPVLLSISVDQ